MTRLGTAVWQMVRPAQLLLVALALSACVTTTNAPSQRVDAEKAEETHITAGLAYLRQRDKDSAKRHFNKALKFNGGSAGAHNGLALVYQMEENWGLAEEHFRKALSIDPSFAQARNNYGAFLYSRQRYGEAKRELQRAAEDVSYDRRYVAMTTLAMTQLKLGEEDQGLEMLRQAIGIHFQLPAAHLELADLYFQRKEYTQAKFHLDQFSKIARQIPRSLWLGIRIERIFGNKDKEASYALALKNLHPYSEEYLEYKKSIQE